MDFLEESETIANELSLRNVKSCLALAVVNKENIPPVAPTTDDPNLPCVSGMTHFHSEKPLQAAEANDLEQGDNCCEAKLVQHGKDKIVKFDVETPKCGYGRLVPITSTPYTSSQHHAPQIINLSGISTLPNEATTTLMSTEPKRIGKNSLLRNIFSIPIKYLLSIEIKDILTCIVNTERKRNRLEKRRQELEDSRYELERNFSTQIYQMLFALRKQINEADK